MENYQRKLDKELEALGGRKPGLLLHSCCGPCSSYVLEYLSRHFRLGLLYYDPNIQPEAEYELRLENQRTVLERYPDIPVYIHKNDLLVPGGSPRYQFAGAGENQRTYGEGDVLPLGESSLQVLHTPGHSPGSVVLLWGNVMIAGDTLFAGSCGRCDLLGGSMEEMFASLKRLGSLSGDYQVCPGHGPATTLETERRTNPYVRHAMQL